MKNKNQTLRRSVGAHYKKFMEEGFLHIESAITQDIVTWVNDEVDHFRKANRDFLNKPNLLVDNMLYRVVNLHLHLDSLKNVFLDSMDAASQVTDSKGRAILYTSLFFELGSQQDLHRDTPYFYTGHDEPRYMGCWVALDDVDETNGALMVVKQSHLLGEPDLDKLMEECGLISAPPTHDPLFSRYNESLVMEAERRGLSKVECHVKKGDMVIWHPNTLHGGIPHRDKNKSRRSFVMHVISKDTPIKHMDYFFHRDKPIPPASWVYKKYKTREYIDGNHVDFRHKYTVDLTDLR